MTEMQQFSLDFSSLIERKCANPPCYTVITKSSPFYYCYWCKIFYCEKCVEDTFKRETDNLREKYLHKQHNLLYITTTEKEYLTDLTKTHLGKNRFKSVDDESLSLKHSVYCNGCNKEINESNGPRYMCASCRPGIKIEGGYVNYCYQCFEHMRKNDEKAEEIMSKKVLSDNYKPLNRKHLADTHCHSNHIYLLMIADDDVLN